MYSKKVTTVGISLLSMFFSLEASLIKEKDSKQDGSCGPGAKPMRVTVRHIDPKGIGYQQGYTTVEGFFPFYDGWDNWVAFLDARVHVSNKGEPALNTGLGGRYLRGSRIWGLNGYYDYRKTNHYHYNQIGLGLESLGQTWDFRVNGYAPVGSWSSSFYESGFAYFQGNYAILRQKYEYALGGFNVEAAAHVDVLDHFPLYFAAGPYYLNGRGASTWGGEARASISIYDYLKIEGNVSYDHLFKWIGQAQVGLTVSFGGKKETKKKTGDCSTALALSTRSYQTVDRLEIVPVDQAYEQSKAINPATGEPYFFTFVNNTSSSLGTYESPYGSLASAQANSAPYGVIYVFPGDGTSAGMNGGIQLQAHQKLWGSVVAQNLTTTIGAITIPALSSGGVIGGVVVTPVITNGSNDTVVALASGNEISGLSIQNVGGSSTAIANSTDITDLTVLNCTIGGPGSVPYAGIGVSNLGGTLTVSGCSINEGYGISIYNTSADLVANISGSNFNGGADSSIYWLYAGAVQGTLTVENCTVNSTGNGVYIQQVTGSSMNAVLNNNQITAATQGVYMLGAGTSSQLLSMSGNTIFSENQSVHITQTDSVSAIFNDNTLISIADGGFTFELDSNAGSTSALLAFNGNTIISQYGTSLYFNQAAGNVAASFENNTITPYDGGKGLNVNMATDAASYSLSFNNNEISGGEYGFYINQTVGDFAAIGDNNLIDAIYDGYGIYSGAGGSSHTLTLNNSRVTGSYYAVYVDQTAGTLGLTLNGNTLTAGSDDYTVYCDLAGGTSSQVTMNGNNLVGYYPAYFYQSGSASTNLSFTNNRSLAGYDGLYAEFNGGTNNTLLVSGNTLVGAYPLYVDQYIGDLNYEVTGNTLTSTGGPACYYASASGAVNSTQTISGNTMLSAGASAISLSLAGASGSVSTTVTGNTLSSTTYAIASSLASSTQDLNLLNNTVTNSGGFNLTMTGGTANWELEGNQLTAINTIPVNVTASGGTVSCMQINNNAVYPTSSENAYVLNGTGASLFTLTTPTGNLGNTNISTTDVTAGPCP